MFKPRWLAIAGVVPLILTLDGLGVGNLKRPQTVGSIAGIKGTVLVDHQPVLDREAVFTGDVISTGASAGAFLNLHGTVAILVENSELALTGTEEAMTMALRKGAVEIRSGSLQPAQIQIGRASVIVRNDGNFPSICRIASADKASVVIADRGRVEIHGAGAPMIVRPGKSVLLENGMPQAAGTLAGKVSGEVPRATVQRGGTGNANPLTMSDSVYWNDFVQTLDNGRVRIALTGGSYLNVGARSQMRIIQHDVQSQQTTVELKLGTMRGEVVKLTKGGKFETQTQTAVIGVVGTIWVVNAFPQNTQVFSVTGDVTVRNIDPNIPGTVVLHAGQSTNVGKDQAPSSPSPATAAQLQAQMQQTDVQEGVVTTATAGAAGAQGGTTGAGAAGTQGAATGGGAGAAGGGSTGIINGVTVGAVGASAVAGAVGIHALSQSHSNIASAESSLSNAANAAGQAATSAANAQSAASQAVSAAQQANNIATTVSDQVNSILKGCGCILPGNNVIFRSTMPVSPSGPQ
ncbi:MAG TPA: FecR domain-containing protein [Terriglobia bacterium]|nr:FecR domain-containing protein [Terriglobia bacterium]